MSYVYERNEKYSIDEILNQPVRNWDVRCQGCEKLCAFRLEPIVKRGHITGFVPYANNVNVRCASLGSDIEEACKRLFNWCRFTCKHSKLR